MLRCASKCSCQYLRTSSLFVWVLPLLEEGGYLASLPVRVEIGVEMCFEVFLPALENLDFVCMGAATFVFG